MSFFYAAAAVITAAVGAYSANRQHKIAKEANAEAKRQNQMQADAQVAAAKTRQEQIQKPVAQVEDARAAPLRTKLRDKGKGIVSGSLNL